jgi:hypothetical protein
VLPSVGLLLEQDDTFFIAASGRLKLRVEKGSVAQLIHYHRTDSAGPKLSHYTIATTEASLLSPRSVVLC